MYSEHLTSAVGPEQYTRLAHASAFYEKAGFEYVHAPWLVQQKVDHATKPPHVKPIHHHVSALNHTFHFAASGEQSFIQMQYEFMTKWWNDRIHGRRQTITPCFRDEPTLNGLKRFGFMKLELIDWDQVNLANLDDITDVALSYFKTQIPCRVVGNDLPHEMGRDIVSEKHGIELGSYGIREGIIGGIGMRWIYATGLAEPRLSYALWKEMREEA